MVGWQRCGAHSAERLGSNVVVREPESLITWARDARELRVLLGYDFSASADAALRWIVRLIEAGPCALTAIMLSHQKARCRDSPAVHGPR